MKKQHYKPKKRFGQHFLVNEDILEKIVNFISKLPKEDILVELGPGQGALTDAILKNKNFDINKFFLVEIDKDMVESLLKKHSCLSPNILFCDFLKLDLGKIFHSKQINIVGNFPYNISSQIIFKIIENKSLIKNVICMLQKEFAQRIVAKPNNKNYGIPSILVQEDFEIEYLLEISAENFYPPPKVESSVIMLKRKEIIKKSYDEKKFKKLVKIAFSQRRKILRNIFKSIIKDNYMLEGYLFEKRAEQLSIEDFKKLYKIIEIHL